MDHGVFRYRRPPKLSLRDQIAKERDRQRAVFVDRGARALDTAVRRVALDRAGEVGDGLGQRATEDTAGSAAAFFGGGGERSQWYGEPRLHRRWRRFLGGADVWCAHSDLGAGHAGSLVASDCRGRYDDRS